MLIDEKVARGIPRDEARRLARLEIGGLDRVKEEVRDVRAGAWLDALRQDLRVGARTLIRRPGFSVVAILTLAVGIGATTAVFSLIDTVLLRPLPFPDSDRLATIWEVPPARSNVPRNAVAPLNYLDWRQQAQSFEQLAAYSTIDSTDLTGSGAPERLDVPRVTPDLLPLLRVEPLVGRWFVSPEGAPGQPGAVILGYGLWQRRFGGDPAVMGRTITLNGEPHEIVGVMPRGFQCPREGVDAWIPIDYRAGSGRQTRRTFFLSVIGRLKAGVAVAQADTEIRTIAERLGRSHPENAGSSALAVPLQQDLVRDSRTPFLLLLAAALLVLLIACANVAGLLVTRGAERDREFAVRSAVGAGRFQLGRQLVVEGLLLSGAGVGLGLLLAVQAFDLLETLVPDSLRGTVAPTLDMRLLAAAVSAGVLTGVVFGLVPLRHASRMDLRTPVGAPSTASRRRRAQAALVAGEVALAIVVLSSTGLMLRTILNLRADPGFRARNILTADVEPNAAEHPTAEHRNVFYSEVLDRVTALPGVVSAGFTTVLPTSPFGGAAPLRVQGRPERQDGSDIALIRIVTSGYLRTLGVPLISGRHFSTGTPARPALPS